MTGVLNYLTNDNLGIVIGILGIITGYILYRRGLKLRLPSWDIRTNNLINNFSSKISKLDIKFDNKEISNLSVSKIVFWNEGREVIDKEDISKSNYLRITPSKESVKILDCKVISRNSDASNFEVLLDPEKNEARLIFDYLNFRWGAVFEVIHTGIESKDIDIVGSIKGVEKINKKKISRVPESEIVSIFYTKNMSTSMKRIIYSIHSMILAGLVLWVFKETLTLALFLSTIPFLGLFLLWKNLEPKGLDSFLKDI